MTVGLSELDKALLRDFRERNLPYVLVWNKSDLLESRPEPQEREIYVSALTGENIYELKEKIGALSRSGEAAKRVVSDLLTPGDVCCIRVILLCWWCRLIRQPPKDD